jgi:hypothetical protein
MKRISLILPIIGLVFACAARQQAVTKEPTTTAAAATSNPIATEEPKKEGEPAEWGIMSPGNAQEYARVVDKVAGMTSDGDLQSRVSRRNLSLVNVMWEDTGRAQGSALGPNISDLTLQVRRKDANGQFTTSLMPVIRPPNFVDRTGDVPADRFFIRVGNERDGSLKTVPLTDVLKNLKSFASHPESILGDGNMLAPRDSHFLVSAQAVFLPIPKSGKAEFNPVLFNYQSAPGSPAVLSILVTRQGSSMQVIENKGDDRTAFGSGQQLYFNDKGNRSAFTAERKTDVEQRIAAQGGPKTEDDKTALQKGADVLFLVQIPLKHHNLGRLGGAMPTSPAAGPMGGEGGGAWNKPAKSAAKPMDALADDKSDVEQAVLGHGPHLGPFNEGHSLRFERDPKFPVRITVQFYKATSNGVASDVDLDSIAKSIGSVYEHADFVGSLVLPENDARRPTAWQKVPHEWFPW